MLNLERQALGAELANIVGFPEITKITSSEFSQVVINIKDTSMDSSVDNTRGKANIRKGKKK